MLRVRDLPVLAAVLLTAYLVFMAAPGLTMKFAPDDMQNIHRYWSAGVERVVSANLLVATGSYRPMGGAFYLPLFYAFGFNPLPYRVVVFVMLCANAWLFYGLARRISGSRESAALGVLACGFHSNAGGAFYSTAVVYEVMCFGFLTGALLYYVCVRQDHGHLTVKHNIALMLLFAAALNSKEMAVVLPPALLLYEVLKHGREVSWARVTPIVITGVLAAAFVLAKSRAFDSYEAYRPVYTLDRYLETTRAYAGSLFLTEPAGTLGALTFWAALFAAAAVLRNRAMLFGAAFAWLAFLPVNFIMVREGFVLYIPLFGLGLYTGAAIATLLDATARRLGLMPDQRAQAGAIAFAALLTFLIYNHYPHAREVEGAIRNAQKATWDVLEEFKHQHPAFRRGERVLFRNTPFDDWDIYFIAKLYSRDRSLQVAVTGPGSAEIRGDTRTFDREFRFEGNRLIRVK